MMYALVNNQLLLKPFKGGKGICSTCKSEVLAKCGQVNIHHWAHLNLKDCDTWKENEGIWHRNWKEKFPKKYREISEGNHRADIKLNNLVIEFQHSPISIQEVISRENHWKDIIWIVDVRGKTNLIFNNSYIEWKNAYKWIMKSKGALLLDTDLGTFYVNNKYKHPKYPLKLYGRFLEDFNHLKYLLNTNFNFKDWK